MIRILNEHGEELFREENAAAEESLEAVRERAGTLPSGNDLPFSAMSPYYRVTDEWLRQMERRNWNTLNPDCVPAGAQLIVFIGHNHRVRLDQTRPTQRLYHRVRVFRFLNGARYALRQLPDTAEWEMIRWSSDEYCPLFDAEGRAVDTPLAQPPPFPEPYGRERRVIEDWYEAQLHGVARRYTGTLYMRVRQDLEEERTRRLEDLDALEDVTRQRQLRDLDERERWEVYTLPHTPRNMDALVPHTAEIDINALRRLQEREREANYDEDTLRRGEDIPF